MATTNPFGNLGLSYMGAETGMGDKIGEAIKAFGTAYLLNASGLQGFMDKKKAEVGAVPKAAVPGAAVPTAATGAVPAAVPAPMGAMVPPGAIPFPVNNPNIFTQPLPSFGTTLPSPVTDDEALDVLRSGMIRQ